MHNLVAVARIYSRPEMICYTAALEAEGIHCCITGNHYGAATQQMLAIGGYVIGVPATQVDQAIALTAELRQQTPPLALAPSLRRRLWLLVALLSAVGLGNALTIIAADPEASPSLALIGLLNVFNYPFPITSAGDYRIANDTLVPMR